MFKYDIKEIVKKYSLLTLNYAIAYYTCVYVTDNFGWRTGKRYRKFLSKKYGISPKELRTLSLGQIIQNSTNTIAVKDYIWEEFIADRLQFRKNLLIEFFNKENERNIIRRFFNF